MTKPVIKMVMNGPRLRAPESFFMTSFGDEFNYTLESIEEKRDLSDFDVIFFETWGWLRPLKRWQFDFGEYSHRHTKKIWLGILKSSTYQPLRIFLSGESDDVFHSKFLRNYFDYSISFHPPFKGNLQFSISVYKTFKYMYESRGVLNQRHQTLYDRPKTRFCNYLYGHDSRPHSYSRASFFDALSDYRHVDAVGYSRRNMWVEGDPFPKLGSLRWKMGFLSDYKFTIAMENAVRTDIDYFTEKICHPFGVGSIPIYYGCPNIAHYFNPAAFINGHAYEDWGALVERVKQVDEDERLYQSYRHAPLVLEGSLLYRMFDSLRPFVENILTVAETARNRRGVSRGWWRIRRGMRGRFLRIWYYCIRARLGMFHVKQKLRKFAGALL